MANQDKKQEGIFEPLKNESYINLLDGIYYEAYTSDETHVTEFHLYEVVKGKTKKIDPQTDFKKAALEWSIRYFTYALHNIDEGYSPSAVEIREKLKERLEDMSIGFSCKSIQELLGYKVIAFESKKKIDFQNQSEYDDIDREIYVVEVNDIQCKISPFIIDDMLALAMECELVYFCNRVRWYLQHKTDEAFWRKVFEMEGEEWEDDWEDTWNGIRSTIW